MMAETDDSRPFTTLRLSADEFKSAFDLDIQKCLTTFDTKITELVFNPEPSSVNPMSSKKLSAHIEFSKAKLEIFLHMTNLIESVKSSWKTQIDELCEDFLEKVEIFLAGTKLETTSSKTPTKTGSKTQPSALYPILFNTAKHIPVYNSLIPSSGERDIVDDYLEQRNASSRKLSLSPKKIPNDELHDEIMETDDEEEKAPPVQLPARRGRASRKSTPASTKKTPAKVQFLEVPVLEQVSKSPVRKGRGRKSLANTPVNTPTQIKNISPVAENIDSSISTPKTRKSRRGAKQSEAVTNSSDGETAEIMDNSLAGNKTPKNVHFSIVDTLNINDDLEIYSPEVNLTRSAPRRKTVNLKLLNNIPEVNLTPDVIRSKGKRKTISSVNHLDISAAPSPKRLKSSAVRSNNSNFAMDTEESYPLESDEASESAHYSPWTLLSDLSGAVPAQPGIYELKVAQAKKPAYIGSCESLRHNLTLHKLKQPIGHKHLDKFVDRNGANVLVRYETLSSHAAAKAEEKTRVQSFVSMYNTTPAYN